MAHNIPSSIIDPLTAAPSATKTQRVAAMQNYIRNLLGDSHHTFLQGSYKNDTAISDINDVDIVAVRLRTFSGVHSGLQFSTFVSWETIFSDIEARLRDQRTYTWTVSRDHKCIRIRGAFNADVVPAVQIPNNHLTDPIAIYSWQSGKEIVNRPRVHYERNVAKHQRTGNNYKPAVRMFKNWAMTHFGGNKSVVSSFKLEALLHAVSDENFGADRPSTFIRVADAIGKRLTQTTLLGGVPPVMSVCGSENICANWDSGGLAAFRSTLATSLSNALDAYNAGSAAAAEQSWRRAFRM